MVYCRGEMIFWIPSKKIVWLRRWCLFFLEINLEVYILYNNM